MSVGFIDFNIVGNRQGVQAMLAHLDSALSPSVMATFLGVKVGTYLKQRASQRFGNEGDDAVGPWAPLEQSTQLIRASGPWQVGPGSPINKRTGELESYITGSEILAWGTPLGAVVKYPAKVPSSKGIREKMRTAQAGRAKPKTVPRPVLGMNERDLAYVLASLAFHVKTHRGGFAP